MTDPIGQAASLRGLSIRPVVAGDVPSLKRIIDAVGLFPSDLLDDMMAAYFKGDPSCTDLWFTVDESGPVAVAYVAPERMTAGTWNLYLIAVHPSLQSQGRGAAIVACIERLLAARGERILLVETSALPAFERTRSFYLKIGYTEEARIRGFYKAGEDKVIFRKALRAD